MLGKFREWTSHSVTRTRLAPLSHLEHREESVTAATTVAPDADAGARLSRSGRLRFALILGGLTAFGPLSIDMYLPALPSMADDLSAANSLVQLTLAAFVTGLGAGQLVAGPLSDAFGRRTPLIVGIALYIAASVLCAFSPSIEVLIGARMLQAFGAAAGAVIARATVRDLFSGIAMSRFFSALMLVTGVAPILAPILGGQLLTVTSWRGIFSVLAAFGGVLLLVAALALPETLPPESRRPARIGGVLRTYLSLLRHRAFLGAALTIGFGFAGMFTYISASSFVLQDIYGLGPQAYSFVFGGGAIGLVTMTQVNARLVGRFSQQSLLRTGLLAGTAAGVVAVVAAASGFGLPVLLPAVYVIMAANGMVMPNAMALAMADHPDKAGSASALLGVLQFLVAGASSPLIGLFGESSAVPMVTLMATFFALALTSFLTMVRPRPAHSA
ncbi:MFS transporter, DHA1 family, bicyclomycin/chloramphenicol resistance protein [Prauserella aidingensis]|uniref:Bcr/CflA family multidrug efflux MFS transporter n=1 Tax=Prauserella aidingensis TaxID=387890 RepID=UPI0020A52D41|nr:Bcr/CflA family multidrug efflux MFS transporter [Prauserella aidingensis]MCP2254544.1 MFS transporter, DHA1 family, bicyclomycin/chloramphenicol resistance protein [Prauserella aidingensis]